MALPNSSPSPSPLSKKHKVVFNIILVCNSGFFFAAQRFPQNDYPIQIACWILLTKNETTSCELPGQAIKLFSVNSANNPRIKKFSLFLNSSPGQ